MERHGTSLSHLAVVAKNSQHGALNPSRNFAYYHRRRTGGKEILSAPVTHVFSIGDGAAAVIVVSEQKAKQPACHGHGGGHLTSANYDVASDIGPRKVPPTRFMSRRNWPRARCDRVT